MLNIHLIRNEEGSIESIILEGKDYSNKATPLAKIELWHGGNDENSIECDVDVYDSNNITVDENEEFDQPYCSEDGE